MLVNPKHYLRHRGSGMTRPQRPLAKLSGDHDEKVQARPGKSLAIKDISVDENFTDL